MSAALTVTASCSCGATLYLAGDAMAVTMRHNDFLKEHAGCLLAAPVQPDVEVRREGWCDGFIAAIKARPQIDEGLRQIAEGNFGRPWREVAAELGLEPVAGSQPSDMDVTVIQPEGAPPITEIGEIDALYMTRDQRERHPKES